MNKFEELFAQYPFALTDEQVKAQTADIIAKHAAENNNAAVWKQCLHQIDLTTLMGDDTDARVEKWLLVSTISANTSPNSKTIT